MCWPRRSRKSGSSEAHGRSGSARRGARSASLVHRPGAGGLREDRVARAAVFEAAVSRAKAGRGPCDHFYEKGRGGDAQARPRTLAQLRRDRAPPSHPDHRRLLHRAHAAGAGAGPLRRAARDRRGRARPLSGSGFPRVPAIQSGERERLLRKAKALFPGASEALAHGVLRKDGQWLQRPAAPEHLKKIPGLRESLFALCNMPPAEYDDRQWEALEAILALLKPAVAHLKVLFGERGQADFTEFAHGALEALGSVDDPSDLLLSLDQKISHVLVDEFQDTSLSQFELLTKLTSGWQEGDGRTLFLVGDPMQSIYRFREAEVSLFLQAKHSGLGSVKLEPIELSTNRRSQEGLVKWFNESFPRVLPAQEDQTSGAVPYLPASPHEPALPGAAVTWHCGYDREEEAKKVVAIVREAWGSKAILVRNRAHLDEIVPALKEAGVRFRALDIEQLGEKQVVQDLYALTRALLHLGDRIAWLACLRAPWCGLTLADLLLLSSGRREEGGSEYTSGGALILDRMRDVTHLSADGQKRVDRARSVDAL